MSIEQILAQFIREPARGAIVLQGKWGRGKTYLWKKIWKEYCEEQLANGVQQRRYAYISLFGINSIKELKQEIFQTHSEAYKQTKKNSSNERFQGLRRRLRTATSWVLNKKSDAKKIFAQQEARKLTSLYAAYELVVENSISNMLICFDDLERRGSNLRLIDFLGLVSLLSEDRNCNVVVIANIESPDFPVPEWNTHREKVFRQEYTFNPSAEHCVSLVVPADQDALTDTVRGALIELNVRNLRIAQRTLALLDVVRRALERSPASERGSYYVARSLTLASYCHNGSGEGAPPLQLAIKHSSDGYTSLASKPEQLEAWTVLTNYKHYFSNEIDHKLAELVRNGTTTEDDLVAALQSLGKNDSEIDDSKFYNDSWSMWRSSFHDNRQELVERFEIIAKNPHKGMNSTSATSVASILRELGRPDLATIAIKSWIDSQIPSNLVNLSDRELFIWGEPDTELLELARDAREFDMPCPTLSDAFDEARSANTLPDNLVLAVSKSTPSFLADYLEPHCDEEISKLVYALSRLPSSKGEPNLEKARQTTWEAIRILASRSPFFGAKARKVYPAAFSD